MKFKNIIFILLLILSTPCIAAPIRGLVDGATGREVPDADLRYNVTSIVVNLSGAILYDAEGDNTHFQIDCSYSSDFSSFICTTSTVDNVAGWVFFNGTEFDPFPVAGLTPVYQDVTRGCVSYVVYGVPAQSNIYIRARSYDGVDYSLWFSAMGKVGTVTLYSYLE